MWVEFFLAWMAAAALLFLPGLLLLRGLRVPFATAFAAAPPVAIVSYELLCIIYARIDVPANWLTVVFPVVLLFGLVAVVALFVRISRDKVTGENDHAPLFSLCIWKHSWERVVKCDGICLLFYVVLSSVIVAFIFVGNLGGPASFPQDADNSAHLSWIQSFAASQNMSTLDVTAYGNLAGKELTIVNTGGSYYPAAWHMLCALIVQAFNATAPFAENVVNCALLSIVLPSAMFLYMQGLFNRKWGILYCGALVCLAFPSFPWGVILPPTGPLYPNFASMCVLPLACWSFWTMLGQWGKWRQFFKRLAYFLLAIVAAALLHPSAVFTAYIICASMFIWFIAKSVFDWVCLRSARKAVSWVAAVFSGMATMLLVVIVWVVLYCHPAFQGLVGFNWGSYLSFEGALRHVVLLSFNRPNDMIVLPLIVAVGFFATWRYRRYLWLSAAYIFLCVSFVVAASTDGFWDSFLTGFWYTDTARIAANAAFVAIPMAALGLNCIFDALWGLSQKIAIPSNMRWMRPAGIIVLACLFVAVNFMSRIGGRFTAFDDVNHCLSLANNLERPNTFAPEERDFVKKVKEKVGENPLILNVSDDGSCFAYATDDLNVVYRRTNAGYGSENTDGGYLRQHIDELATSRKVQDIVRENHIEYVLVLDEGGEPLDERCYHGFYSQDRWAGFNRLTENTPGFHVVLSEGDMKLYKIDERYL